MAFDLHSPRVYFNYILPWVHELRACYF